MNDFFNLKRLEQGIKVSLPPDEEGFTGRQCPEADCEGYFKVMFGTGLKGKNLPCHCPYCGHTDAHRAFLSTEQAEYLRSIMSREAAKAIHQDFKSLEFEIKPKGPFGIGVSMKLDPLRLQPVRTYREKSLETHAECPACTLRYAVYGVFAFCPDCREHNSLQILEKNLEVVSKMLDMTTNVQGELAERLIENALEDCVSAFDGFGRELCRVFADKASDPAKAKKISFQNIETARQIVQDLYGLDFRTGLEPEEWTTLVSGFQKRHVVGHKMGVIDEEYVRKTGDASAIVGRKVTIAIDEVREVTRTVSKLARYVSQGFRGKP